MTDAVLTGIAIAAGIVGGAVVLAYLLGPWR
jgi:hypothetical protein